jgi:hypothetical protein
LRLYLSHGSNGNGIKQSLNNLGRRRCKVIALVEPVMFRFLDLLQSTSLPVSEASRTSKCQLLCMEASGGCPLVAREQCLTNLAVKA